MTATAPRSFPVGLILGLIALLGVFALMAVLPQTGAPPPPSFDSGKGCPEINLSDYVIEVMMYGGPNGTASYFTVSKLGVDYNLAGVLYSTTEVGYSALEQKGAQVWHTYVNTKGAAGSVSATELLRAGDLYIRSLKSQGVSQYRQIRDINNLSYSSYKSCGDIINPPKVLEEIFEDGTLRKIQYWGFIIK